MKMRLTAAASLLVALSALLCASCSSGGESPVAGASAAAAFDFNHEDLMEMVRFHAGDAVDCPDYLPPINQDPGDQLVCFKTKGIAATVSRPILEELKPDRKDDSNAELGMIIEKAVLSDGCEADIITNGRPYVYGSADLTAEGGRCIFWFIDRSRCGDGSLIVMRTSG